MRRGPAYFLLCAGSLAATGLLFTRIEAYDAKMQSSVVVCGAMTAAFYGWLPLYLPELFPTRVRATGQGLAFNLGRVFAAAGAVGGGELVRLFGGDYPRAGATMSSIYALG